MEKLSGFNVDNKTEVIQTVRICRPTGELLVQLEVAPGEPGAGWGGGHGGPIWFIKRADCVVQAPEGVLVDLNWAWDG